ncbi:MAG: ABC transporter ATP-binding protein [Limnochordia bacterium]
MLKNISFTVKRGETVALVGDNGAGKTTLIKLLLGLYAPNKGKAFFEGMPYDELTQEYLYSKMGVVFQDFKQYHFTIRENIAFGDIKQLHNDEALMEAARKGQADKLILAQEKGLDTFLGREYEEDGLALSGGEWQRIGVSRAHVSDKEILILDEPAAKLDPVAEMEQFMAIKHSLHGRTAVLVSHRLGFARLADKIVVLKDGEMVELGTHEELMKANRHYAEMFRAQAEWYEGRVTGNGF